MPKQIVELVVFGMVGVAASIVHFIAVVLFVELAELPVWGANILGFLIALPVSYFGHAFLTFAADRYGRETPVTSQSMGRFVPTAALGFALNQSSVVVFAEWMGFPYRTVLLITIIAVAGLLFVLSKFWVFLER